MSIRTLFLICLAVITASAAGCRHPYYYHRTGYQTNPAYRPRHYPYNPSAGVSNQTVYYQSPGYVRAHYCTGTTSCPVCYPAYRTVYVNQTPSYTGYRYNHYTYGRNHTYPNYGRPQTYQPQAQPSHNHYVQPSRDRAVQPVKIVTPPHNTGKKKPKGLPPPPIIVPPGFPPVKK